MEIRVAGHQVDTGDALRTHVEERLEALAEKHFSRAVAANVTLGRAPHDKFSCDIVMPVSRGMVLKSSDQAGDAHAAFDGAAGKIERQLKRHRDRLKEHRGDPIAEAPMDAGYRVLAPIADDDAAPVPEAPAIIAETHTDIPETSVGNAVMLLDLRNTNALLFKNGKSGELNMVYRREDGTIGWVEPDQA